MCFGSEIGFRKFSTTSRLFDGLFSKALPEGNWCPDTKKVSRRHRALEISWRKYTPPPSPYFWPEGLLRGRKPPAAGPEVEKGVLNRALFACKNGGGPSSLSPLRYGTFGRENCLEKGKFVFQSPFKRRTGSVLPLPSVGFRIRPARMSAPSKCSNFLEKG